MKSFLYGIFLIMLNGCSEEEAGTFGKINLTLTMYSGATSHTDPTTTAVTWGCVVMTAEETACIYFYNGVAQVDGSISTEAQSAGPGTTGYKFVADGAKLSGYEPGSRLHSFSSTIYQNGSVVGTPSTYEQSNDFYGNKGSSGNVGADKDWSLDFGTTGASINNAN